MLVEDGFTSTVENTSGNNIGFAKRLERWAFSFGIIIGLVEVLDVLFSQSLVEEKNVVLDLLDELVLIDGISKLKVFLGEGLVLLALKLDLLEEVLKLFVILVVDLGLLLLARFLITVLGCGGSSRTLWRSSFLGSASLRAIFLRSSIITVAIGFDLFLDFSFFLPRGTLPGHKG